MYKILNYKTNKKFLQKTVISVNNNNVAAMQLHCVSKKSM